MNLRETDGLALYIHWPFCVSKCPYCDFNSHVRDHVDQQAWRQALIADMRHEATVVGPRKLESIFFGGGTPSLMPPETVAALIEEAARLWPLADRVEITLEANPNSVEAARFADLAHAGVNRVSLGLQSLDDQALQFLGRAHSASEGIAALEKAQAHFGRVSFDLIYALPGQDEQAWEKQLSRALGFGTTHLSLYQLTIEAGTRFETLVRQGAFIPADPDHGATLFEMTQAMTTAAGLPAYEISNHAAPGAQSRHNLTYWRYGDYVGIGPGAHGRRRQQASIRHKKPENWMAAVARNNHGLQEETPLPPEERGTEALMMGLRLAEGVDLSRIEAETGLPRSALIDEAGVAALCAQGFVGQDDDRLRIRPSGMLLLDNLLPRIIA